MMFVLISGGKIIDLTIHQRFLFFFQSLGKIFLLIIMIVIISIPNVILENCPLLHSFMNDTGNLLVNKTSMTMNIDSTINCQWLIVGSSNQVC